VSLFPWLSTPEVCWIDIKAKGLQIGMSEVVENKEPLCTIKMATMQ
jgi:hypothetical protein